MIDVVFDIDESGKVSLKLHASNDNEEVLLSIFVKQFTSKNATGYKYYIKGNGKTNGIIIFPEEKK